MDEATAATLVAINRRFYQTFFAAFDETRTAAWPGWSRVLASAEGLETRRVLDLGCGNGRFAAFIGRQGQSLDYEGWDDNAELLRRAEQRLSPNTKMSVRFRRVDLIESAWPAARADLVTAFGVLHHVPTLAGRQRFLSQAWDRVSPEGLLAVCFWQFAPEYQPRVATAPWSEAGLEPSSVDPGDYLVRWRRGGEGLRYCHHAGPDEVDALTEGLEARTVKRFVSDGSTGDLNLYVLLRR